MSELVKVFENVEFGKIRVVIIDDEPWFVAKELSELLEYSETSKMLRRLDDDEIKKIAPTILGDSINPMVREMALVNESGLYNSVFGSKKPNAKEFKKWVTSDLLPTLRKTGGYVVENRAIDFVSNWLPNLDDTSKNVIASMLEDNQKLRLENSKQKEVIKVQSKEITYKEDVIIGLVDTISLEEKRQTLNKVVRHKGANYQERWQLLYKHFEDKYHLNLKIRKENWDKVNKPKSKSMVDFIDRGLGKIPELYEIATKLFEGDIKEIISHYEDIR